MTLHFSIICDDMLTYVEGPDGSNQRQMWREVRWREAIKGGGELSEVEGSSQRWRGTLEGGGEQSEVEGRSQRWRVRRADVSDGRPL